MMRKLRRWGRLRGVFFFVGEEDLRELMVGESCNNGLGAVWLSREDVGSF
jgi:hypothetical protein